MLVGWSVGCLVSWLVGGISTCAFSVGRQNCELRVRSKRLDAQKYLEILFSGATQLTEVLVSPGDIRRYLAVS